MHGWVRQLDVSPSTCHWSVEVCVSQDPHQGATVVFGYIEGSFLVSRTGDVRERYDPNIYRYILTGGGMIYCHSKVFYGPSY